MFGLEMLLMAGTAAGVGGALFSAFSASRAGELQSKIARQNRNLNEAQAGLQEKVGDFASVRANFEASRVSDAVRRVAGAQVAHFAAANLDPTVGSPLLLARMTAEQGAVDVGLTRAQGMFEEAEARARSATYYGQAAGSAWQEAMAKEKAFEARFAGYFGAGTAFLSAARLWPGLGGTAAAGGKPGNDASYAIGGIYD